MPNVPTISTTQAYIKLYAFIYICQCPLYTRYGEPQTCMYCICYTYIYKSVVSRGVSIRVAACAGDRHSQTATTTYHHQHAPVLCFLLGATYCIRIYLSYKTCIFISAMISCSFEYTIHMWDNQERSKLDSMRNSDLSM